MRCIEVRDVLKGQLTRCLKCRGKLKLNGAIADLDGPAFRAYYHYACAPGPIMDPRKVAR